jgi:putative hydrolase of the HAD superfamily
MNVVFDFGGVLFGWQPARLIASTFPELAPTDEMAHQLGRAVFGHDDWQQFDAGKLVISQVVPRTASRLALPQDRLLQLVQGIGEYLMPLADTLAVLAELKAKRDGGAALKLYYLSNMPAPYARVLEQRHDFLKWFDGGIFSGDVNLIKPDAAIYQLLQRQYQLKPDDTFFIDDLAHNIAAAQALGWRASRFESAAILRSQLFNMKLLNM